MKISSKSSFSPKEELLKTPSQEVSDLESYIQDFWDFLPISACYFSPLDIILTASKKFRTMSGYEEAEIVGKKLEELFSRKEEVKRIKQELREKGRIEKREAVFVKKGGEEISVLISVTPRQDKEASFLGYFLSLFDVSKAQLLQKGLSQQVKDLEESRNALLNILEDAEGARAQIERERNKTLSIINSLTDGLFVLDGQNKIVLMNLQAEKLLATKAARAVDKDFFELIPSFGLDKLTEVLAKKQELFREELSLEKPKKAVLEVTTVSLLAGEGKIIIFHDISREKLVEKMKTEFVSVAAHQLRTPLSAIKWTLRMLLDGDLGELIKEQREFVEKTYISNERMINLISDLLDVTRIEEGRYLYKPVLADLELIVQEVINSYRDEIRKRRIVLSFKKLKEKIPKIMTDIERIKLVIQNLVDNAIRYTLPGGEIAIFLGYKQKEIKFSIKDAGIGIPQDQQERIFTKFFRGTNAFKVETEGSGLGLFIARNIVEAHGGKIWFESGERRGSTFYFTLPAP